jgi:hypothetical protein
MARSTAEAFDDENLPATTQGTSLQVYDFGEDEGAGLEKMRIEGMLTPFINIIQPTSAQLKPSRPEYIPNAKMGMLVDTASGQVYDGDAGIEVMPVHMEYVYTAWIPIEEGGGFRGVYSPDIDPVKSVLHAAVGKYGEKARFMKLPWRNEEGENVEFIEQWNVAVLFGDPTFDRGVQRGILPFTSTKIATYKAWMNHVARLKYPNKDGILKPPPMWAHKWNVGTTMRQNKKGDWYVYQITLAGGSKEVALLPRNSELYAEGRKFYEMWNSGDLKADYKTAEGAVPNSAESEHVSDSRNKIDDEIPF